ncbi:MAG TPA: ROK family protein, partial [Prolixibacteraceae bacterium]|nr:ROK family protein [Prolixibacteraceae bacterium]
MKIVGVDVGGTKIAAGLVDGDKIIRQTQVPTPNDRPQTEVVNAVIQAIEEVYDSGVKGIGIGVPGLVDLKE